ncbi:Helix-turn-helix domain-containing protein [Chitinophaga eiseniae]|uniref:Helix-turn-helix domain-containing protein n=1 Tax=Chitinophaga eiseniae TaxID=634771 RepID=A0A1T4TL53_9BACT|nr:helix-turn-helix domain-containing protein [Chitinophaga eiseniae]SKA41243.1 Helix-turn-helix domain-containing protein [Chitinophaga eiseniae]
MTYETFPPHPDLSAFVKCYWTLAVPAEKEAPRQRVLPDGCIELFFILGDDIRRFVSEDTFIIQPREMVLGQITEPYFIQPAGHVHSFAVRFYPYGFANFITLPIQQLANKETPLELLFGPEISATLTRDIIDACDTTQRIQIIETFLMNRLNRQATIDQVVKSTVDALLHKKGGTSIHSILEVDLSKRRQLERKFLKQIGMSPKQLGKVIRLQAVLKMLLHEQPGHLTNIAYERDYHDQAHFIKDFKEFTGVSPRYFLNDDSMALSSLLYSRD